MIDRLVVWRLSGSTCPTSRPILTDVEQNFHDVEKILHWYKLGTVDKLIAHNREVLECIPASIQ